MNYAPLRTIEVDFGEAVNIDAVGIRTNGSSFGSKGYGPGGFEIQFSADGDTFSTALEVS